MLTEGVESHPNISDKLNYYCTQIITYLNPPLFDKEKTIEVKQLIELTQQMQAGTIEPEDFYKQSMQSIEQIRSQIPPLSFAWRLLDIVASLVVIIMIIVLPLGIPIAIACGCYTAVKGNKFEFSFFSKSSKEKKLDEIKVLVNKIKNVSAKLASVTENSDVGVEHRTIASNMR
ncbi:hypothetical protein RVIR1_11650 [Candidatus Rickettsiella viridis]|uniref:Uncharacterized protein n=1 Tax=Candidatus Rickettsiella viridis TaxID=676208 RepID=A0A2Z5UVV9_9COXI|nr:hypothetical protein [Candidatus Rickettsiella viridis]BBB15628.1 hypothetical protein RVIR1_11650 [Candidatus Rickettsiella viridis]